MWQTVLLATQVLAGVTAAGKGIVLTSHSMEECEVLCQRLGIMKAGEFNCIGSAQHLKSRFGRDYTMIIKPGTDFEETRAFKQAVADALAGSVLVSDCNLELTYTVPETFQLADLFDILSAWRNRFGLQDYSLSQTSLEQIFLQFASNQEDEDEDEDGKDAANIDATTTAPAANKSQPQPVASQAASLGATPSPSSRGVIKFTKVSQI